MNSRGIFFKKQYVIDCIEFEYPNGMLDKEAMNMKDKI